MGMLFRYHDNNIDIKAKAEAEGKGAAKEVAPKPIEEKVESQEPTLTKKDIKAMNGAKLRKLAEEKGIGNPEELTVGELKTILCEMFS